MNWKVGEAKQHFSDVVRRAEDEPQLIYKRDRLVAAVIDAESFDEFQAWRLSRKRISLGRAFDGFRQLAKEERYKLVTPRRENRRNTILSVLHDASD